MQNKQTHKWHIVRNGQSIGTFETFEDADKVAIDGDEIRPYKLFWLN